MKVPVVLAGVLIASVLTIAQEARIVVRPEAEVEIVRSYYNEGEDKTMTSVFIPVPVLILGETSKLEINAHFSYQGRQLSATPEQVQIVFSVPCDVGSELETDPVICVDGECASYHPRGAGVCAGGLRRERTSRMIDLPYETFLKVATGRKVKVQLQSWEVELTDEQTGMLRSLGDRMSPKKVKPSP